MDQPAVGCSEGEHVQPRGGSAAKGKDGGELSMQTDISWTHVAVNPYVGENKVYLGRRANVLKKQGRKYGKPINY